MSIPRDTTADNDGIGTKSPAEERGTFQRKLVFAGSFGNLVEWYDWNIYGLMAAVFAPVFFPGNVTASLSYTLMTFAIGFLARPIGAIVLSPYGDKRGRRNLLSLTVILMGASSLVIAVIPPFSAVGIVAPIVLLLARLLQGLSAGGEYQSGSAYLVESAAPNRRGFFGSFQNVSVGAGTLLGTAVAGIATAVFSDAAVMHAWGWRIPFLLGGLMGIFGFFLRRRMPDTPQFTALVENDEIERRPLLQALKNPRAMLHILGLHAVVFTYYLWFTLLPTIAHLLGGLPLSKGFLGTSIGLIAFCICQPFVGMLSDHIGARKPILIAHSIGFILFAAPAFLLLRTGNLAVYITVSLVGAMLLSLRDALQATTMCEQFPARFRASGVGISFNVVSSVFGGGGAVLAGYFASTGNVLALVLLLVGQQLLSLIIFIVMPETAGRELPR